jgi:hypothetical protein
MNKIEFKIQYRAFREGLRDIRERYPSSSKAWDAEMRSLVNEYPSIVTLAATHSRFITLRHVTDYSMRVWYKINSSEFPVQHVRGVKLNFENQDAFGQQFYKSRGL